MILVLTGILPWDRLPAVRRIPIDSGTCSPLGRVRAARAPDRRGGAAAVPVRSGGLSENPPVNPRMGRRSHRKRSLSPQPWTARLRYR